MAFAKGATIPGARLLDAVEATAQACSLFEVWAHVHESLLEPGALHPVDEMQVRLAAWQERLFGHVPRTDAVIALGVIEELGEAFDSDADAEDAIDALGDTMIYAAQLCTANRLAVRPVLELAEQYVKANHTHEQGAKIVGELAHVVGKNAQNTRGLGDPNAYRPRLVDALAMVIGKVLEDCICGHELTVDLAGVFLVIGREVLQRKQGDTMIPATVPPLPDLGRTVQTREDIKARALEHLHAGAAVLETPEAKAEGDFVVESDPGSIE